MKVSLLVCLVVLIVIYITLLVNLHVPEPYMDEIFHIPQARKYCKGKFTYWNGKITTPPGFHALGVVWSLCSWIVFGSFGIKLCSVIQLRVMNLLLFFLNCLLLVLIRKKLFLGTCSENVYIWSIVISLQPVYSFFSFLFYTDISSMTCLLVCYLSSLHEWSGIAALAATMAILIRQTNAVWVAFCLMSAIMQTLALGAPTPNEELIQSLLKEILTTLSRVWSRRLALLQQYWQMMLVLVLFMIFVWVNGGIVVGDKSAHQVSIHPAQLPYAFIFLMGSLLPYYTMTFDLKALLNAFNWLIVASLVMGSSLLFGRVVHPYTLADNRHIAFYLWRWFLSKTTVIYFLIPIASLSVVITSNQLSKMRSYLWILAFYICSMATLIPASLFEPRYFLPTFFFTALHLSPMKSSSLKLIALINFIANGYMLHLFLFRPFEWNDGTEARFIW